MYPVKIGGGAPPPPPKMKPVKFGGHVPPPPASPTDRLWASRNLRAQAGSFSSCSRALRSNTTNSTSVIRTRCRSRCALFQKLYSSGHLTAELTSDWRALCSCRMHRMTLMWRISTTDRSTPTLTLVLRLVQLFSH